jgi:hypothetical protein
MQAEKRILETDAAGHPKQMPSLPANARIEAVFLVLDQDTPDERRKPSPRIAGKGRILGDLFSPVIPPEDWDALK